MGDAGVDAASLLGGEFRQEKVREIRTAGEQFGLIHGAADEGGGELSAKLLSEAGVHGPLQSADQIGQRGDGAETEARLG